MKSEVPREIRKWNWSAFLLGPIWAIGNKVLVGLLGCLPSIATFILMFLPFILMPFGRDIAFVPLRVARVRVHLAKPASFFCHSISLRDFNIT